MIPVQSKRKQSGQLKQRALPTILLGIVLTLLFLNGCADSDPSDGNETTDTAAQFDLSFAEPAFAESGRTLDTLFAVDLDDDGQREYVVTSIVRERIVAPDARADRIEIYRFDTGTRSWQVVLVDTVFWSSFYTLREMTGDRSPELIVELSSGGNDPIASRGMRIYSGHGGAIRAILNQDDGDPSVQKIEGEKLPAVVLHRLIWPPMVPHVQAVPYVADLLAFTGATFESVSSRHAEYFRQEADMLLKAYGQSLKTAVVEEPELIGENGLADVQTPNVEMFISAAGVIIALDQAGQSGTLRSFWNEEKDTLRVLLPEEQFDQLEELYAERILK